MTKTMGAVPGFPVPLRHQGAPSEIRKGIMAIQRAKAMSLAGYQAPAPRSLAWDRLVLASGCLFFIHLGLFAALA